MLHTHLLPSAQPRDTACEGQATHPTFLSTASEPSLSATRELRTVEEVPPHACRELLWSCTHPPEAYRINDLPKRHIVHLQNAVNCEAALPEAQHGSRRHLVLGLAGEHQRQQDLVTHNLGEATGRHQKAQRGSCSPGQGSPIHLYSSVLFQLYPSIIEQKAETEITRNLSLPPQNKGDKKPPSI